jgi:long-subunit acyl-CoA synthetase (AMP-forming)
MVVLAEHIRPQMNDDTVRAQVEKEMSKLLEEVNSAVADHEQLHMIVVKREPWSIENGYLTPTMKVRRGRIEKAMEPHVEGWYSLKRRVHWH